MSKVVKTVASIGLPIAGAYLGGPIGGAIGGAIGGVVSGGGLTGAALGAIGGYAGAGAVNGIIGNVAGAPLAESGRILTGTPGVAGASLSRVLPSQGATFGSGISGAVTGGGMRALGAGLTQAASSAADPSKLLLGVGNQLIAQDAAQTAKDAAKIQSNSINQAITAQQPYSELGTSAVEQIKNIQADPVGYIQSNSLYNTLADDATRRLMASQASKGKVGSGGTAAALQDQLLQIGNGLVSQQISQLSNQAGIGQASAGNTSNMLIGQGNANSAGLVGANNAMQTGYQKQLDTLLALQQLNTSPTYQATPTLSI